MKDIFTVKFKGEVFPAFYFELPTKYAFESLNSWRGKDVLHGIDTETQPLAKYFSYPQAALYPHLSKLRLVQIFNGKEVLVFDMNKMDKLFTSALVTFLETERFVAHNAIFDLQFFMKLGVRTMNLACTRIIYKLLSHAVFPDDSGVSASLANITNELFKEEVVKTLGASHWEDELTFEQIQYAALDAVCVLKITERLAPALQKFGLERIYKLTKEAQFPIAEMQLNGLRLDVEKHKVLSQKWREDLHAARKELIELTGLETFTAATIGNWLTANLPSDTLELWPRTETGRLATDAHVFADFSYLPIVVPFSKFQKALKLTTTYGNQLVNLISPETGKLHSSFNLCGARTGRLSCSKPNLQQAPRDKEFRSCFIPDPGNVLIRADFNQIEVRIGAELSRDSQMLKAYREGIDIHKLTATQVSKKRMEDVTEEDRQLAKACVFGFMFGLGAKKFAHYAKKSYGVEVTSDEAEEAVQSFRTLYDGYREWQLAQANNAAQSMTSRTPCGKLRKLNIDNCYGASMNTPVQGGAAECMLYALVFLYHELQANHDLGAKLVNCVHDEVLVQCHTESVPQVKEIVKSCMVEGFRQVFPNGIINNIVSISVGKNWAEAK